MDDIACTFPFTLDAATVVGADSGLAVAAEGLPTAGPVITIIE